MDNQYLNDFIQHLKMSDYAKCTIRDYQYCLQKYLSYLKQKEIPKIKAVTAEQIEEYKLYLKEEYNSPLGKPLSEGGFFNHLKALRCFYQWLEDTNQILLNPIVKLQQPRRTKKKLPVIVTEEEIIRILESCPFNTPAGLRDRAILEILYATGIRRMELVNLNVSDFSFENEELFVIKGKGKKDRIIPLGKYACKFTEAYLKLIRSWLVKNPEETALFLNSVSGKRLNTWNVSDILEKAVERSGIKKRITPHMFRHSMASHLLRNGADLRHIQALLGHESISSTEIYTHLLIDDLKKVVKESHPHGRRSQEKS